VQRTDTRAGRIDALLANASYALAGAVEETTIQEARAQFETNYFGVVRTIQAVLPVMRSQGGGRIVAVSSAAGLIGLPLHAHYSAAKCGVRPEGGGCSRRTDVPSKGVASSDLALFRAYPELRERFPRHAVLSVPTPVKPLPLTGVPKGMLYVKRDDRSCLRYGGNKPRKLEFIIGAALSRGARRLVTTGGLGTHHGLATTILGRDAGLATTLVLLRQPVTEAVQRSLLLDVAYGAELVYGANVTGTAVQVLRVLSGAAARGEKPFLVATGGSSARGNLGFVSAGFELAEQIHDGRLPEPAEIYVPVGTGGTLAGLVAGLKLAGLSVRVVGVLVTDILPPSPRCLAVAACAALKTLRRAHPRIPHAVVTPDDFDLARDQLGPGYGAVTPAGREAVEAAADCDLVLETTYTGKCLAEVRARAQRRRLPEGPVLFWNTHNGADIAAGAPRTLDPEALPPRFRAFVRTREASESLDLRVSYTSQQRSYRETGVDTAGSGT
jgi:D-cysteine desulfhydrase